MTGNGLFFMRLYQRRKRVKQRKTSKLSPVRPKKIPLWHQYYRSYKYNVYAFFAVGVDLDLGPC